ncbi:aquaporin, partial [Salmonella sp. s55044]|uniref:aquaporin n=1 Tax=Salmonella sp. s55044 TaxID=3159677 RepID=UPI00397FF1DD
YGFAVTAATLATYVTSGGGFNPAVSLCTGMLAGYFDDLYIYVVAPICGCLISAAFFRLILGDEEKRFLGK